MTAKERDEEKAKTFDIYLNNGTDVWRAIKNDMPNLTDTWIEKNLEKIENLPYKRCLTMKNIKEIKPFEWSPKYTKIIFKFIDLKGEKDTYDKIFYIPKEKYFKEVTQTLSSVEATRGIITAVLLKVNKDKFNTSEEENEFLAEKFYSVRKYVSLSHLYDIRSK